MTDTAPSSASADVSSDVTCSLQESSPPIQNEEPQDAMATSPTIATGVQDPNGGNEAESVPVYRSEPVVEHPSTEAISDKVVLI